MNTAGKILRNTLYLFLSLVIAQVSAFITMVYLARTLGPGGFGKLNLAFTIVTYFSLLALSGIPILGVREIAGSKDRREMEGHISNIMVLRILLAAAAFCLLGLFTTFLNRPLQMKYLILLYGLGFLAGGLSIGWIFQGVERMEYSELPRALCAIIYMSMVLLFIKSSTNILLIPCFALMVNIFGLILSLLILFKLLGKIRFSFNLTALKKTLVVALPLSLLPILAPMIHNVEKLSLGFISGDEELGYYIPAYRFILLSHMAIGPYYTAIFPVLSRYYHHSLDSFKRLASQSANIMFIISVPLACAGFVLAGPLINLIYGTKYAQSAASLQILIWVIILIYINSLFSQGLIAAGRQNRVVRLLSIQLLITAGFCLIFIPRLGMKAAALAILLGEVVAFLIYYKEFNKIIGFSIGNFIPKPLLASLGMVAFLKIFVGRNIFLLIFIGATIYLLFLILLRGFPRKELGLVWTAILGTRNKPTQ